MDFFDRFARPVTTMLVAGALLLIIFGSLWWHYVYQSPANVFWSMLESNLATTSVTKHLSANSSGQMVDESIKLQFGAQNISRWLVTIKQSNGSVVKTDSIGTPTAGYVRYTAIQSGQKTKQGKKLDFSSLLNTWGVSKNSADSLTQLYAQAVLDINHATIPPIGYVSSEHRRDLITFMHQNSVFSTDFSKTKQQVIDGKRVYVYEVNVQLAAYAQLMQSFAKDIGLHDLDNLDPSNYQNSPPATVTMAVSPTSHQLVKLTYDAAKFSETYDSYGAHEFIQLPTKTVPVAQLETRLQKLQK